MGFNSEVCRLEIRGWRVDPGVWRARSPSPTSVPVNRSGFGTANGFAVFVDFGVPLHRLQEVGEGWDKPLRILQIKPQRGTESAIAVDEKSEGLGVAVNLAAVAKIEALGDGGGAFKTGEGVFDGPALRMGANGAFSAMSGEGGAAPGSGLSG